MSETPILHGYWRSSASYRVRIALNLKGITYRDACHHLRHGEHRRAGYRALNPQGLVPTLEIDGAVLTQSLAICDYLDETRSAPPLLPPDPILRAKVRAFAQVIACDTHPVQNLRVLSRLREGGIAGEAVSAWAAAAIAEGLAACDALAEADAPFAFGAAVTLADVFLVPQLYNARRFGVAVPARLQAIDEACAAVPAFARAVPERQLDAEG